MSYNDSQYLSAGPMPGAPTAFPSLSLDIPAIASPLGSAGQPGGKFARTLFEHTAGWEVMVDLGSALAGHPEAKRSTGGRAGTPPPAGIPEKAAAQLDIVRAAAGTTARIAAVGVAERDLSLVQAWVDHCLMEFDFCRHRNYRSLPASGLPRALPPIRYADSAEAARSLMLALRLPAFSVYRAAHLPSAVRLDLENWRLGLAEDVVDEVSPGRPGTTTPVTPGQMLAQIAWAARQAYQLSLAVRYARFVHGTSTSEIHARFDDDHRCLPTVMGELLVLGPPDFHEMALAREAWLIGLPSPHASAVNRLLRTIRQAANAQGAPAYPAPGEPYAVSLPDVDRYCHYHLPPERQWSRLDPMQVDACRFGNLAMAMAEFTIFRRQRLAPRGLALPLAGQDGQLVLSPGCTDFSSHLHDLAAWWRDDSAPHPRQKNGSQQVLGNGWSGLAADIITFAEQFAYAMRVHGGLVNCLRSRNPDGLFGVQLIDRRLLSCRESEAADRPALNRRLASLLGLPESEGDRKLADIAMAAAGLTTA